jgi:hypothetical protein
MGNTLKIVSLAFVFLLSMSFIAALGVSSPYWNEHPLKMYAGETRTIPFILVNRETESSQAIVTLEDGAGIAEITSGTEYTVPFGTANIPIELKVTIPDNADIGETYNVKLSVKAPLGEGGESVQVGITYNLKFPVQVVEESKASSIVEMPKKEVEEGIAVYWLLIIGIITIALVLVSIMLILKRKK